jgi:hypothetical protein
MDRNRVIWSLNPVSADGLAYVMCGSKDLEVAVVHASVSRPEIGSPVFVWSGCSGQPLAGWRRRDELDVLTGEVSAGDAR